MDKFAKQVQALERGEDIAAQPEIFARFVQLVRGALEKLEAITTSEVDFMYFLALDLGRLVEQYEHVQSLERRMEDEEDPALEAKLLWDLEMVAKPDLERMIKAYRERTESVARMLAMKKDTGELHPLERLVLQTKLLMPQNTSFERA